MHTKPNNDSMTIPERLREIPQTVWILGVVSLLMNISSVIISTLSPLFMVSVLGASHTQVGLIRGVTEAIAYFTKIPSGMLSDYIGKRKVLIVIGYFFAAFTKPIFATTSSIMWYALAQFLDRVSNGMRDAPRDALVADYAPPHAKGACFGIRQGFATVGAFLGAIAALYLMCKTSDNYQFIYWLSTIPVLFAVLFLVIGVKDSPNTPKRAERKRTSVNFSDLKKLGFNYWYLMVVVTVFMLSRFSEVFLVINAKNLGMRESYAPIVMIIMNLGYTLSGYIVAINMDRIDRRVFLWIGFPTLMISYSILGCTNNLHTLLWGTFLYGVHMGTTQGVLAAMVADLTPKEIRATSFGIYSLISGLGMAVASTAAGKMSDLYGISTTFIAGCGITGIALVLLSFMNRTNPKELDKDGNVL